MREISTKHRSRNELIVDDCCFFAHIREVKLCQNEEKVDTLLFCHIREFKLCQNEEKVHKEIDKARRECFC